MAEMTRKVSTFNDCTVALWDVANLSAMAVPVLDYR